MEILQNRLNGKEVDGRLFFKFLHEECAAECELITQEHVDMICKMIIDITPRYALWKDQIESNLRKKDSKAPSK